MSVNAYDEDGWTALGRALVDTAQLVPFLIERGADVSNKPASDSGYTPIQLAGNFNFPFFSFSNQNTEIDVILTG